VAAIIREERELGEGRIPHSHLRGAESDASFSDDEDAPSVITIHDDEDDIPLGKYRSSSAGNKLR